MVRAMTAAGARKVGQVEDRPWGGRTGLRRRPRGQPLGDRVEPEVTFDERGAVTGFA